jgi:transcriptional regulator with GAF, ATPase, and Fis domain
MSLCADTPENMSAIQKSFKAVSEGKEQTLPVLELRRKDNGKPVWVHWWSRPLLEGNLTRTMFIDITEQVLMEREKNILQQQNLYLQEEIKAAHNFEEIVGQSKAVLGALEKVSRVAGTDSSVLIMGETGTGKELIARAVHNAGPRKHKPLIKINCAALPSGLIESELFGHEKGAFSGAISRRIGRFELADGGTIFLDEVGELPLDAQAKLLRVLQEKEFERVGGSNSIKVDVRVIAATNRDLQKAIANERFREDLFYRLNVFPVQVPPLRERVEDIPLLVNFLLDKFRTRIGRRIAGVSTDTIRRLQAYSWPGNVRELENLIERALILGPDSGLLEVNPEFLREVRGMPREAPVQTSTDRHSVERAHILATLTRTNWVIDGARGAAKLLDLHPNTLRSRMKKFGIQRLKPLTTTHVIS